MDRSDRSDRHSVMFVWRNPRCLAWAMESMETKQPGHSRAVSFFGFRFSISAFSFDSSASRWMKFRFFQGHQPRLKISAGFFWYS
jgi:hypothetical protein